MKRNTIYLIAIGVILALSATSYTKYSVEDYSSNSSSRSTNITVTIQDCKDMYCLDQCDSLYVIVYRQGGGLLDYQEYDGSCIYYFTVDVADVCAGLRWGTSCGSLFYSCTDDCQDVTVDPNLVLNPICN
jgi:hypothetical protein